jgi:hypothetical protein
LRIFLHRTTTILIFSNIGGIESHAWPCDREVAMNKQLHRANGVEAPEVKQALAKAEEYAKLASTAQTLEERDRYDRMSRKWFGIADGWRVIAEFDQP